MPTPKFFTCFFYNILFFNLPKNNLLRNERIKNLEVIESAKIISKFIADMKLFDAEWSSYLSKPTLDEDLLKKANQKLGNIFEDMGRERESIDMIYR